jgi:hypothetical protein
MRRLAPPAKVGHRPTEAAAEVVQLAPAAPARIRLYMVAFWQG